ncbi:cytochrome b561 [Sphingomonas sp. F9_3S_D5_B_2]
MTDRTSFDTATRIVAADDGTNYDNVAVTLHWLTALLVLAQFIPAITWDYFSHETAETLESVHVSLGVLLTAVIIARIVWRLMPGHQVSSLEVNWVRLASKGVHYLLYLLLVAQAALGFAFRWAQGHPVSFFGLFAFPSPLGLVDKPTRHTLHFLHEKLGWAIVIVAFGHALAALYHHYGLKDRVLQRMLPSARRG